MALLTLDDLITATQTIAGEARNEPLYGQVAVGEVLLNRLNRPKYFKCSTLWEVCHKPLQFSFWNNASDRNLEIVSSLRIGEPVMLTALHALLIAIKGQTISHSKGADHYHTLSIKPNWADETKITTTIGNHVFYKLADQ